MYKTYNISFHDYLLIILISLFNIDPVLLMYI
jgi:hypothetical protein